MMIVPPTNKTIVSFILLLIILTFASCRVYSFHSAATNRDTSPTLQEKFNSIQSQQHQLLVNRWHYYFLQLINQVNSYKYNCANIRNDPNDDEKNHSENQSNRESILELKQTWFAAPNELTQFPQHYLKLIQNGLLSSREDLWKRFSSLMTTIKMSKIGEFGREHLRVLNELLKRAEQRDLLRMVKLRNVNNLEELRKRQRAMNIPETFDSRMQWPSCIHVGVFVLILKEYFVQCMFQIELKY